MEWKEKGTNKYPDIIISDCFIKHIQVEDGKIIVDFSEYGFLKKDTAKNKYYRTNGATIVVEQCVFDSIEIKEIRTQKLSEEVYFDSMYDVEPKAFIQNINTKKWIMEIVEEFYSASGAFYIAQIRENEKLFLCQVKLQFKNLIYFCNEIRYDCPF